MSGGGICGGGHQHTVGQYTGVGVQSGWVTLLVSTSTLAAKAPLTCTMAASELVPVPEPEPDASESVSAAMVLARASLSHLSTEIILWFISSLNRAQAG